MNKLKTFFMGLFFIFLYFFLSISMYLLLSKDIYNESNLLLSSTANIFVELLILFIFILIFRKKIIPDFYDFKKNYKEYINKNFKYWLFGLGIMIFTNIIIGYIVGDIPSNESLNRESLIASPLSTLVAVVITAPILEELITRKTFKDVFKNQYIYIIISGLIFGSLHLLAVQSLIETLYVIPYAALGCSLAKIYYNTDNIWANICFHSFHNFIAVLLIFVGV